MCVYDGAKRDKTKKNTGALFFHSGCQPPGNLGKWFLVFVAVSLRQGLGTLCQM